MNAENLLYAETHEWVSISEEDGAKVATIGISDFAVEQLTDLVFMDLPDVGSIPRANRMENIIDAWGRQPYDAGQNTLAYSHVFGPGSDTAFWGNFDWDKALDAGMKAAGLSYSGEYGFVDTYMYWPITHMVAPADEALGCAACHAKDGRLANLAGFHLPGSNPTSTTGLIGLALVVLTALGIIGHGLLRLFTRKGETND